MKHISQQYARWLSIKVDTAEFSRPPHALVSTSLHIANYFMQESYDPVHIRLPVQLAMRGFFFACIQLGKPKLRNIYGIFGGAEDGGGDSAWTTIVGYLIAVIHFRPS